MYIVFRYLFYQEKKFLHYTLFKSNFYKYSNLEILPLDESSAERSAYILNSLKKLRKEIGLKDSLIAGIVLEHNANILTRNVKHFEFVSDLRIET